MTPRIAYMWTADDITIEIEEAERAMLLVRIETPAGGIDLLGMVAMRHDLFQISEVHIQGLSPGALGRAGLNAIGRKMLEVTGARAIVIQGRTRTTGRNPGSTPRAIRFPR